MPKANRRRETSPSLLKTVQSGAIFYLASSVGNAQGARSMPNIRDWFERSTSAEAHAARAMPCADALRGVGRSNGGARVARVARSRGPQDLLLGDGALASLGADVFTTQRTLDLPTVRRGWRRASRDLARIKDALLMERGFLTQADIPPEQAKQVVLAVAALEAHVEAVLIHLAFPGAEEFEFVRGEPADDSSFADCGSSVGEAESASEEPERARPEDYAEVQVGLAKSTQVADNLSDSVKDLLDELPPGVSRHVQELKMALTVISDGLADVNDGASV